VPRPAAAPRRTRSTRSASPRRQRDERTLLSHRGAYMVTEPAEPTPGILDNLVTWSRDDDWI
jgi:hypothetical protein